MKARPTPAHVVLASASPAPYLTMRDRPTPRAERHRMGRALRQVVKRSALGDWTPPDDRPDPVSLIERSHEGRQDWLVPVRVARMVASPYGFLRGTATVMAADCAALPATGITPVICGDAHVGNFGFYGSPERELVLDLNDFDEAHPGAWEWDLRRLAASIWVAGRQNGFSEDECEAAVASCVAAYREQVRHLAEQPLLARSFERLDLERLLDGDQRRRRSPRRSSAPPRRARTRTSDRALPRFTEERDGRRRIVEEPPLITRLTDADADALASALDDYLATLAPHWRGCSAATRSSTSPTRWSASAAWGCARTSRCARAAAPTTWCSSSSSRPAGRWSRRSCTATPPGTSTRGSGSWSTSRPCRRSATRCSAGPRWTTGSTTSASSAT